MDEAGCDNAPQVRHPADAYREECQTDRAEQSEGKQEA